jgi:hypothetical protein
MENLWHIITGAPWWVNLVFIYLLHLGFKAIKPRTISLRKVVTLPLFFVAWSAYGLYQKLILGFSSLGLVWVAFIVLGAFLGVMEVRSWKIARNRRKGEITIPGNYSTLILIFLVFILKFFWGYYYATHTGISYQIHFLETATTSLATGFFVGRAGFYLKCYFTHQERL